MDKNTDLSKVANGYVNPLTALGLMDVIRSHKATAFIQTAAFSSLSRILLRLAAQEGLQVINLVRKDDQVEALKSDQN